MRRLLLFFVLALVIGVPAAGATGTPMTSVKTKNKSNLRIPTCLPLP